MTNYRFCGYDSNGNLFVDGVNDSSAFVLAELPKGSGSFTNIDFTQKIEWPGGVQWDGKFIAVGDTDTGTIYRTNAAGTVKGSTQLSGSNYVNQFWIVASSGRKKHKAAERRRAESGRRTFSAYTNTLRAVRPLRRSVFRNPSARRSANNG